MRKTIKRIVAGLAAFLIVVSIVLMFAGCASTRAEAKEVDDGNSMLQRKVEELIARFEYNQPNTN